MVTDFKQTRAHYLALEPNLATECDPNKHGLIYVGSIKGGVLSNLAIYQFTRVGLATLSDR